MTKQRRILGMLLLALAAPATLAQTASVPAGAQAALAVDPASVQALKDMGAYLQSLKRFQVTVEVTGERVLEDGQKLQHTADATLDVARPNRVRVHMESVRSARDLYYDGKTVALYTPALKVYSAMPFSEPLTGLVEKLQQVYGIEVPLADLFVWGTPAAPLDRITSAMNAGQDVVGGVVCDHYAFRQDDLDWQIWISAGPRPLPRKMVITSRADEARPQSVSMIAWNLQPGVQDAVFRFVPPKGAAKAEFVPLKTK